MKVPVSPRALQQRINRKLRVEDEVLRKSRPVYDQGRPIYNSDLGEFYVVDVNRNFVVAGDVDLQQLGRELGALQNWEELAE